MHEGNDSDAESVGISERDLVEVTVCVDDMVYELPAVYVAVELLTGSVSVRNLDGVRDSDGLPLTVPGVRELVGVEEGEGDSDLDASTERDVVCLARDAVRETRGSVFVSACVAVSVTLIGTAVGDSVSVGDKDSLTRVSVHASVVEEDADLLVVREALHMDETVNVDDSDTRAAETDCVFDCRRVSENIPPVAVSASVVE